MFSFCDCKTETKTPLENYSEFLNYVLMIFMTGKLIQVSFNSFVNACREPESLDCVLENLKPQDNEALEEIAEISDEEEN